MGSKKNDFYKLMNYPIPTQSHLYQYIDTEILIKKEFTKEDFSREKKGKIMDEYIESINKWSLLLQYIPCVRQVYLCNSITFNALHKNSDIDICIISRHGFIWFTRLFSLLFVLFVGSKRNKGKYSNNSKKICLSFYIDEHSTNLYHLRKRQGDIYLSYWIAHTVLLYTDNYLDDNHLIQHNTKLLTYLPEHPQHQTITLPIIKREGNSTLKTVIEYILCTVIGKRIHIIMGILRGSILQYKKSQLSSIIQKDIIIKNTMLKFHQDRRDIISHKRKTRLGQGKQSDNQSIAL